MANTVLITGASRGIGRAAALRFAAEGYNVGINYYRSREAACSLVREIAAMGGNAEALPADVSDPAQVKDMLLRVRSSLGRVNVLVNNAGTAFFGLLTETSDAEWARILNTNLSGAFYCARGVLPDMIDSQRGCIINVASMWGQTGASCEVAYSASKAALIGFTKALAKEVGPSGIRVNCVSPGVINTDMNASLSPADLAALKEDTPLCRIGVPADAAEAIFFLASDAATFITGQTLGVNGGFVI